ncbi:Ubiquitin domain-containing protein DSK2a [Linum perenne]
MGIGGDSSSAGDQTPTPVPAPEEDSGLVVVNIRGPKGIRFSVNTNLESTVEEFKPLVAQNCDIPANEMRLIYKGRIIKGETTLISYGVQANQSVDMVHRLPRDSSAPMTNVSSLHPDVEQVMNENPRLIKEMMNAPGVQCLLSYPELFRKLLMSNPIMLEIIDENPDIEQMINDPVTFCQMLETIRNPELTREVLRIIDLTKRKIESSPMKYNKIIRRYEEAQQQGQLLNDIAEAYDDDIDTGNYQTTQTEADASSYGPNTTPLPNPWTDEYRMIRGSLMNHLQNPAVSGSSNQLLELQQSPQQATQESPQTSSSSDAQSSALPSSVSSMAVLPEEPYETQLSQLREMGFLDTQENIRALRATDGNVDAAVELLLKQKNKAL